MNRPLGAALAVAVLAGALVMATPSTASACGGGVLVLRSLHLEAVPSAAKVRRGQRFVVSATVTRPADEDPAGLGVHYEPPASVPAEEVTVGVSLWTGKQTYFWGIGLTNADGEVAIPIRVPRNAEKGPAFAAISGRHWVKQDCPDIMEDGYLNVENFITVKR